MGGTTEADLMQHFSLCGHRPCLCAIMKGASAGTAVVCFKNAAATAEAKQAADNQAFNESVLTVSEWSMKKRETQNVPGYQKLFVEGFAPGTRREDILKAFDSAGHA